MKITKGATLIASVPPSATVVKAKVNGQLQIFAIINGHTSLIFSVKLVKVKGNVSAKLAIKKFNIIVSMI